MHFGNASLSFEATWTGWAVVALCALAVIIALIRRPAAPRATFILFLVGLLLLACATVRPTLLRPSTQSVMVMVDLSASTRTARYRDRASLERRIRELLRDTPYQIQCFADGVHPVDAGAARLPDLPSDRTTYTPPAAAAILLFSDCRFSLPAQSPPTYICVDTGLDDPPDAAISKLEIRGAEAAVTVRNSGPPRKLAIEGVALASPTTLPTGSLVISRPLASQAAQVSAEISAGDAWPENDALRTIVPPPEEFERWWIGAASPGSGWREIDPHNLPTDSSEYLRAGLIVLDNVAAADLSDSQQQRLEQYVRDLGGGVLIVGGDHAFAAGAYTGTILDSLSPLASNPPLPTTHWTLLADGSGSMSEAVAGGTRWSYVTGAIAGALPRLPADDVVTVGSFAQTVQWWIEGKPAREVATTPLPPASAYPHGPTNLQPALESIARSVDGKMPVQLLVLSDFDTQITGAPELAELLKSKRIHLQLLAIGEGTALPALRQVAAATGGSVLTQLDPARWAAATRELAQAAGAKLVRHDPIRVTFADALARVAPQAVSQWNRVWQKPATTLLADARAGDETVPMAAHWNVGEGRVLAAAFSPDETVIQNVAAQVAKPPRDPRFHVLWDSGSRLRIAVDAIDGSKYLNGQELTLEVSGSTLRLPQSGPGRYELEMDAPRSSAIATLRAGGRVLERIALAGRYAPEFDAIGNDLAAMHELASRSGGAVIPPDQSRPIDIHWPPRRGPMTSQLAIAGALFIGLGLIVWRRGA
jgi:hypothetical protein